MRAVMRPVPGLMPSLGASTSLTVAGTLVLAALSTIVGFKGWPEIHDAGTRPAVLAQPSPAAAPREARRALVVAPATPPSRATARAQAVRPVRPAGAPRPTQVQAQGPATSAPGRRSTVPAPAGGVPSAAAPVSTSAPSSVAAPAAPAAQPAAQL
ncbi:MAG: hypothetical protein QOH43_1881, partial [Solirubrobacteraceae bacterium]|nr:hypothetical protein [Solirubrobacteraceae bacterium]